MKKVAFLGASVTAQSSARETGEMTGYVEAFREIHAAGLELEEVIVYAYPGNRLTDAGLILAQEILPQKPDIVILELTIEDRSRGSDFDERHLTHLTQIFIKSGTIVIFFAMPKPDRDDPEEDLACEMIRRFAETANLPFCAAYLPPGSKRSDYYRDGVHTNVNGALFYADVLARFLKELMEKHSSKNRFKLLIRRLYYIFKENVSNFIFFPRQSNLDACCFQMNSIAVSQSGDFKTIVIRNHTPKQSGGSIRLIQRQEIGNHSPVVDVEVLTSSGEWKTHQISIWDPYCHYTRHSFVTLVKVDQHDFKKILIKVSSTLPNYATCRRHNDNTPSHGNLCMRSDQPFWVISDSTVDLSIKTKKL
jgi:lysophospholipase L1-like esterase